MSSIVRGTPPKRGRGPGRSWKYPEFPRLRINECFVVSLDDTNRHAVWAAVARANRQYKKPGRDGRRFVSRQRGATIEVWRVK